MAANAYKESPVTQEYETQAKNLLKAELKRQGTDLWRAGGEAWRAMESMRQSAT